MSAGFRSSFRSIAFLDLLACLASFSLVLWLYGLLLDGRGVEDHWTQNLLISSLVAWTGIVFVGGGWRGGTQNWFDLTFCAVGFNLVVQYGLNYLLLMQPIPWPVAVAGGALSVALVGALHSGLGKLSGETSSILLVGYDAVAAALAVPLRSRIIGVLAANPACIPSNLPALGDLSRFDEVVTAMRPKCIIVTDPAFEAAVSPRRLLDLHYSGVVIEQGTTVFEDVLQRVCWQRLRPVDLLLASPVQGNRSVKTVQAIYTNLAALALLLAALPLLVILGILASIANGGPAFESVPCSGLQKIPFLLMRFQVRRRDGSVSWMGKLLTSLRMIDLPQLLNVVRGEMGLFGPPPVRRAFADRLCQLLPAYPHRFAVKPGMLGWSQAHLRSDAGPPDDIVRLGYDLYYANQQSPSFDIDIVLRTILRAPEPASRPTGSV